MAKFFHFIVVLIRYFGDIRKFYLLVQGSYQKNISIYPNGRSLFYIVVYKPTYGQTFL